jgi:hypothetical protein
VENFFERYGATVRQSPRIARRGHSARSRPARALETIIADWDWCKPTDAVRFAGPLRASFPAPRGIRQEAFVSNVVQVPEAGPGIEAATQAALWILGRTHQAEGAERAAKLALGFLLAGAAVVRSEYGPDYAGWLLLALAQEHGRAGHESCPPTIVDRGYDPAAGRAARRTRPDPTRAPYDRDRRRDRRSGSHGD